MELLKSQKNKSLFGEALYIIFNIALAALVFVMVLSVNNIWLPIGLVLLSKWRVLAVRPRYWWLNLLSNSVDMIVSVGYVIFLYAAQGQLWLQIAMMIGFIVWLLFLKPGSSRLLIGVQSLVAIFVGVSSLALVAYETDIVLFVVVMWLIGYLSARHFLSTERIDQSSMLCLLWGFVMAEIGWLGYQWLFAYSVFGVADFKLVQLALIATILSFLAGRAIDLHHSKSKKKNDLMLAAVFSLGLVMVLVIVFNNVSVVGSI